MEALGDDMPRLYKFPTIHSICRMFESNTALLSRLKDVAWFRIGARLFVRDLVYCAHQKIWLSGLSLGKSKSDPDLVAEEKRQFIDNQRRHNAVSGKFGQGKRRFGLALIREKLALTQGLIIAMNILVMNLEKLLEPLFLLFICRLDILWDRGSVNDAHSDLFLAHGVMA